MRIFSSAKYCFRIARRMSLIALAAPVCRVFDFWLIFVPFGNYDELKTLSYAIPLICSIGADVKQAERLLTALSSSGCLTIKLL